MAVAVLASASDSDCVRVKSASEVVGVATPGPAGMPLMQHDNIVLYGEFAEPFPAR